MKVAQRVLAPIGVLLAFFFAVRALLWLTEGSLVGVSGERVTFDALLFLVGAILAWGALGWLGLSVLLVALSAVPGAFGSACGVLGERITPGIARRTLRIILGVTVVAGPILGTAPAHAATPESPETSYTLSVDRPMGTMGLPDVDRPTSDVDANRAVPTVEQANTLPSVDRPMSPDPVNRPPTRDTDLRDEVETHVVKRGDTLWDIAEERLPEGASAADITAEWQRWYEANKDVIGSDPDLILPGQILQAPPDDGS